MKWKKIKTTKMKKNVIMIMFKCMIALHALLRMCIMDVYFTYFIFPRNTQKYIT